MNLALDVYTTHIANAGVCGFQTVGWGHKNGTREIQYFGHCSARTVGVMLKQWLNMQEKELSFVTRMY